MLTGEKMDRQYRLALLIIFIPLITLAASTLTYYFGYKPSEINANGTPIEPKIQTQNLNLIDEDGKKFKFVPGKWYFVYFDEFNDHALSKEKYNMARSSKTTLRRESHRLRRMVIYKNKEMFNQAKSLRSEFPQVIFLYDESNLFEENIKQKKIGPGGLSVARLENPYISKSMFLVDSYALVVWEFSDDLTFSDIFEDLEVLL